MVGRCTLAVSKPVSKAQCLCFQRLKLSSDNCLQVLITIPTSAATSRAPRIKRRGSSEWAPAHARGNNQGNRAIIGASQTQVSGRFQGSIIRARGV